MGARYAAIALVVVLVPGGLAVAFLIDWRRRRKARV
jgi:hypothetical protein